MDPCKIDFSGESKTLAEGVYADLQKQGAQCGDLDGGYQVANYAGIHCPDKADRTCIKGRGDGAVEAEEVLEYAFNNYEKYREILEGRLGSPLPWLLDDFDSKTDFDAKVRARIQAAIVEVKRILAAQGLKEGTPEYREKLAVGLHWFVASPSPDQIPDNGLIFKELGKDGLGELFPYLKKNGGLKLKDENYSREYSALDALKNRQGKCTEKSKILFATLKLAGIPALFVDEIISRETETTLSRIPAEAMARIANMNMGHVCIGIHTGSRLRLLDPSLVDSDAQYAHYYPLSLRQYLSRDYVNRGISWTKQGDHNKAIADFSQAIKIDPKNAMAHFNRGFGWVKQGDYNKAIADYSQAIKIDPKNARAHSSRGLRWAKLGDHNKAMADFNQAIKIDPKWAGVHLGRGSIFVIQGKWDRASRDFATAFQLKKVPFADFAEALANFLETLFWQADTNKKDAKRFQNETGVKAAMFQANVLLSYALWLNGKQDEANSEFFDATNMDITFKIKPSKGTKQFIKKMLGAMPAAMKKDKDVKEGINMLRSNF